MAKKIFVMDLILELEQAQKLKSYTEFYDLELAIIEGDLQDNIKLIGQEENIEKCYNSFFADDLHCMESYDAYIVFEFCKEK